MMHDLIDFVRTDFAALLVILAMILALCITISVSVREYVDAKYYNARSRRMRRYRY